MNEGLAAWLNPGLYTLQTPQLLLAIPAVLGFLIFAYLKRGQGKRRIVATLLFLREMRRNSPARKIFVPPPRFFYELLLLLLILAALAGLGRKGDESRAILLIDNSFSMAARDGDETLLDRALAAADSLLGQMGFFGRQVKVFAAAPSLEPLSEDFETPSAARRRLASIRLAYAQDNLEAAIERITPTLIGSTLHVFSDRARSLSDNSARQDIRIVTAGSGERARQNVALTGLASKGNAQGDGAVIRVAVSSFARVPAQTVLILEGWSEAHRRFDLLERKVLLIPPLENLDVELSPADPARHQSYKIRLEAGEDINSITEDDSAWLSRVSQQRKILLVSLFSPRQLGLDKIPGIEFIGTAPEKFAAAEQADAAIFHHYAPATLPDKNALFVLPPEDNKLFPAPRVESASITRWQNSHPVVSYINFPALELPKAASIDRPAWAEELISSTAGAVAVAGEMNSHRYVALGFEIFPYEGKISVLTSVLTLNILKWLGDFSAQANFQPVYARISSGDRELRYIDPPSGGSVRADSGVLTLPHPGLAEPPPDGGAMVAVNFFSPRESNTLQVESLAFPKQAAAGETKNEKGSTLAGVIAALALILVASDLLFGTLKTWSGFRKAARSRSR